MSKHEEMAPALEALKILNHPVRLSILCNLIEKGEMSAGEIVEQEKTMASQSQVSQYLGWLREKKYVQSRKDGQYVYYKIASDEVQAMVEPSLAEAQPEQAFQFERVGYFCADRYDHTAGAPVFNRTATLKDLWAS